MQRRKFNREFKLEAARLARFFAHSLSTDLLFGSHSGSQQAEVPIS